MSTTETRPSSEVISKPLVRERLEAVLERYAPAVGTRTGRHVIRPPAARGPIERAAPAGAEVDAARFREVTMGDEALARGLVETFERSAVEACTNLEAGLERGDFALAKRAAHTLAGASANMGAALLESLAAEMEHAAAQREAVTLRPLVAAARRRLESALSELRSLAGS